MQNLVSVLREQIYIDKEDNGRSKYCFFVVLNSSFYEWLIQFAVHGLVASAAIETTKQLFGETKYYYYNVILIDWSP